MSTFLQTATPLYPPAPAPILSPEEVKAFYAVDRGIFSRLVAILGRDPIEAYNLTGFWVWLQGTFPDSTSSIMKQIDLLPDAMLSSLADETATCLQCVDSNIFIIDPNHDILPLMQQVVNSDMRLGLFHQNRKLVRDGVNKAIDEVCNRALDDILRQCYRPGGIALLRNSIKFGSGQRKSSEASSSGGASSRRDEEREVVPDDRTIFLTFSKGYPISQEELTNFFSSEFGDVFEGIIMQEVDENEQPLFAKMVMRKASIIPTVLSGQPRAKFNINRKHVWARKFVVKKKERQ